MGITSLFKNKAENRLHAGWRILGHQLLLVLALLILDDYVTLPLKASISQNGLWLLDAVTGILAFGVSVWLAGRWLDHRSFADFGFHLSRQWFIQLGLGAALGALLMGMVFLMEWMLGYVEVTGIGYTVQPGASLIWVLPVMLIHYIGVSFTEEIWTRGYLLRNLLEGFSWRDHRVTMGLAVLVSSMVFALPHAGNPNATVVSMIILFVFGVMCAVAVLLTGELAIPMGLHLTWNFFQGNIFGFPVSGWELRGGTFLRIRQLGPDWFTGGAFGPEAGVVGLLAILLGIALMVLSSRIMVHTREQVVERKQVTA